MAESMLSTARVARLLSVTETTVKRWADSGVLVCEKTPGGHRKFRMSVVVEFAKKYASSAGGVLTIEGEQDAAARIQLALMRRDTETLTVEYVYRALSGKPLPYLTYLYENGMPTWEIYDRVVREGLRLIGDQWMRGTLCVNEEHVASHATIEALAVLQSSVFKKPPVGATVVCSAVGPELHEIGIRCAGYVFEQEGWNVVQLGANVPAEEVVAAVKRTGARAACASLTIIEDHDALLHEIMGLHRGVLESGAELFVGGSAATILQPRLQGNVEGVFTSIEALQRHVHHIIV